MEAVVWLGEAVLVAAVAAEYCTAAVETEPDTGSERSCQMLIITGDNT